MIRHLRWRDVTADAPDAALHTALFATERAAGCEISRHDHDFYEAMVVTAGQGTHKINGVQTPLATGDLLFLRPPDAHAIEVRPGGRLHWINVAFPSDGWTGFCAAARLGQEWTTPPLPPTLRLDAERASACRVHFETTLARARLGHLPPTHLDLCAFLAPMVGFFAPTAAVMLPLEPGRDAPPWLAEACRRFAADPDALREGLPALRARAPFSDAHLARVLKAATGQTPTEYVNTLRLSRASALLTTTARPIIEIAGECGFEQLGYFYRLFKARYGQSPACYRRNARRLVGG